VLVCSSSELPLTGSFKLADSTVFSSVSSSTSEGGGLSATEVDSIELLSQLTYLASMSAANSAATEAACFSFRYALLDLELDLGLFVEEASLNISLYNFYRC